MTHSRLVVRALSVVCLTIALAAPRAEANPVLCDPGPFCMDSCSQFPCSKACYQGSCWGGGCMGDDGEYYNAYWTCQA